MGEAKRRKQVLPDSLKRPLQGRREALMAGMAKGPDGKPRVSSRALTNFLGTSHSKLRRLIGKTVPSSKSSGQ